MDVALPSSSPVPPADGVVTDERLLALLRLAAEYDDLDFKRMLDLSTTRDEVELAKDVGAMQVKGGHIVIGVDDQGNPTSDMDGAITSAFDPANLAQKMQKYLAGAIDIATSTLARNGHTIVLICVKPNPKGCAFFRIDGKYTDHKGKEVAVFRAGDLFWRQNTRSVRITIEGLDEIIERRFLNRRDDLLREWASAQRVLGFGPGPTIPSAGSGPGPAPPPSFALGCDEVVGRATELLRQDDDIGLRQLLDDGRRRGRAFIEGEELAEDQLPSLLDSVVCIAAAFLTYERELWFDRSVQLLADLYAATANAEQVKRLGYSSHIDPLEKAPRVWLAIIQRVFALGGIAVRRQAWEAVRTLTVQLPAPLAQGGYEANWLRHALTAASRAKQFAANARGLPIIGLIDLARDDAGRLECLRSDGVGPQDEVLLSSIAQFDVLSNLAAIDAAQSTDIKVFYTNFARFHQERVQPTVERLLTDPAMRKDIFRGTDEQLATALDTIGALGRQEGIWYDGFRGWQATPVERFIAQHLPTA